MRTFFKILILLIIAGACTQKTSVTVTSLKCEYKINPLGVDVENPRLSWILKSDQRAVSQKAYQVLVSSAGVIPDEQSADMWNSQKIRSDKSIHLEYDGKPLESNKKYHWKVKIWDQNGDTHESETAFWTTGFLKEQDWKAKWIGLDRAMKDDYPDKAHPVLNARMLRHEFNVDKEIKSATAIISGLGLFELYLNGEKIGDQVLAPGLTQYNKRAFYMTFDVTKHLQKSKNAVGVVLGNGRYFAPRAGEREQTVNFGFPKVICQIEICHTDGSVSTIFTDESWKLTNNGPIRGNNEYDGEYYDARMELKDWHKAGFDDSTWMNAELVGKPGEKLVAQPNEPIKIMEEVTPVSVRELKKGTFIFDMGQNMVGWLALNVKGKSGEKVTMRFSETLREDGTLFLDNIRSAEVTDTYVLKGEGDEKWEPSFTYHGFRFVEMTGFPGTPDLLAIKGKVVYDAIDVTGSFSCSNPLVNSIYKNAYWGIRGNYRSIPTDCPQRDERHGWLGDRSAECTGESYVFNISSLYNKWVTDIRDCQLESGSLSDIAPAYWPTYSDNTTWPGTYLFASDMLYTQYGDLRVIETNYPYMQKWISHMSQYLNDGIMPKDTYGDWCMPPEDLKAINSSDPLRITSAEFIGTTYFYYELRLMQKFATLLGKEKEASAYSKTADEMKTAFNRKFLEPTEVKYSNNTTTANILALAFGLVPEEHKGKIVDNLLQKILGENNGHVGNGIVGGQWLMRTLTNTGHEDVACLLAAQSTYPSWGYMANRGATTIWELWNGDYGDPGMNSGNHVMLLGDLIIWFYENLGGIKADPANPAFKHILMKPQVAGDLTFVKAAHQSIYGEIKSGWKLENNLFIWDITIPANTTATVYVPTRAKEEVLEGGKSASKGTGIKFVGWEENTAVFEIQSGSYSFTSESVTKKVTMPYLTTPVIVPKDTMLVNGSKLMVTISGSDAEATIRYTTDGSMANESSSVYAAPFEISGNTMVRARAFREGYHPSSNTREIYNYIDPVRNGINWLVYPGAFQKMPDFSQLKPIKKGINYRFSLKKTDLPKVYFAMQLNSFIQIDKEGKYTFYINSNDGSRLYMDDQLIIDNDGEHGAKELSHTLSLSPGKHKIRADYFQSGGGKVLSVSYSSDEIPYQPIPESILFKTKD
jgi:alpha-L-rhamnosidase